MKLIVKLQILLFLIERCKTRYVRKIIIKNRFPVHERYYSEVGKQKELDSETYNSEFRNCECSCQKCYNPRRCCRRICKICYVQQAQFPSLVLPMLYPVPFFVYATNNTFQSIQTTKSDLKETETGESVVVSTGYPTKKIRLEISTENNIPYNANKFSYNLQDSTTDFQQGNKFECSNGSNIKIALRKQKNSGFIEINHSNVRKVPKYGVIPIPDDLASELMLNLKKKYERNP